MACNNRLRKDNAELMRLNEAILKELKQSGFGAAKPSVIAPAAGNPRGPKVQ